jgi:putative hemolysin
MEPYEKAIDIEKAIRAGNNKFLRSLPGFIIRIMKRLIHEDEMNATIYRSRHLDGIPFVTDVLVGWNVKIRLDGIDNLPPSGRYIFASNHPVGGIDAMAFFDTIGGLFPDIISPANELLYYIPNMRSLIFGLNVFGKASRETAAGLHDLFDSDRQIFIFPAGEVSRRNKGKISDNAWQKSFISKSVEHKRDIIPVHISGRNSNLFYNVAAMRTFLGIKMFIETMLLPREMMKQRNSTVTITAGRPIPWQTFTDGMSHFEWAQKIKSIVYSLPENQYNYETNLS